MPPSTGLRARLRAELTNEIKDEARRQLAAEGAPGPVAAGGDPLPGHGVVRHLPLLPQPGRPADGPDRRRLRRHRRRRRGGRRRLPAGTTSADAGGPSAWPSGQWALTRPHEYALVYGSPVPGYRAPEDTIGPASRVTLVLARIVDEATAPARWWSRPTAGPAAARRRRAGRVRRLADLAFPRSPTRWWSGALMAWTQLFGMISFELFGHFHSVVDDVEPVFERALLEMGRLVGLPRPEGGRRAPGTVGRARAGDDGAGTPAGGSGCQSAVRSSRPWARRERQPVSRLAIALVHRITLGLSALGAPITAD